MEVSKHGRINRRRENFDTSHLVTEVHIEERQIGLNLAAIDRNDPTRFSDKTVAVAGDLHRFPALVAGIWQSRD